MPGVDASIYGNLQVPDPIGQMSKFATMQNSMNQNRLFQLEYNAKMALGPIIQRSVRPDGTIDYGKAAVDISSDPRTAPLAPSIISSWAQANNLNLDSTLKELDIGRKKYEAYSDALGGLADMGPNVKQTDVRDKIVELMGTGLMDKATGLNMLAGLPPDGPQLQQYVGRVAKFTSDGRSALEGVYGSFGDRNAPQERVDPATGQKVTGPRALALPLVTSTGGIAPPIQPGTPQGVPQGPPQVAGPQAPPQGAAPPQAGAPAAPPQPVGPAPQAPPGAPPPGTVPTELGPYQQAAFAQIAKQKQELDTRVQSVNRTVMTLNEAEDAIKNFKPGGGGAQFAKLGQIGQALGMPQPWVDRITSGFNPETGRQLGAGQEFQKLMVNYATGQMRELLMGGGRFTNLEFQKFQEANPNLDTDPRAVDKIFKFMKRVSAVDIAQQRALPRYMAEGRDPAMFNSWWEQQLLKNGVLQLNKSGTAESSYAPEP